MFFKNLTNSHYMIIDKKKSFLHRITVLTISIICIICSGCASTPNLPTAKNVNLQKYMGKWYEIARIQTPFQKGKTQSQAIYTLVGDNYVIIENSAISSNGAITTSKANAYAPNKNDLSKLRVCFFWPFYSDYWIFDLAKDYQWALVGTPDKKYLWILSRTPTLPNEILQQIISKAQSIGFNTKALIFETNNSPR